ncbi:hypothetical protein RhiirA1_428092, partial [Rhizophagus irregularis]
MSHKYFDRDSSNWNILDFLKHVYLKSLEIIFDQELGTRREKAREHLDNYRTA